MPRVKDPQMLEAILREITDWRFNCATLLCHQFKEHPSKIHRYLEELTGAHYIQDLGFARINAAESPFAGRWYAPTRKDPRPFTSVIPRPMTVKRFPGQKPIGWRYVLTNKDFAIPAAELRRVWSAAWARDSLYKLPDLAFEIQSAFRIWMAHYYVSIPSDQPSARRSTKMPQFVPGLPDFRLKFPEGGPLRIVHFRIVHAHQVDWRAIELRASGEATEVPLVIVAWSREIAEEIGRKIGGLREVAIAQFGSEGGVLPALQQLGWQP